MDTVRRNEQIPSARSQEKLRTESLLKQKMCSSKKHSHTSASALVSSDISRPQLFPTSTSTNNQHLSAGRNHYQNGDFMLQKPRVYTHDDQPFLSRHPPPLQPTLSSSSASSTLSVKDKSSKEMNESR